MTVDIEVYLDGLTEPYGLEPLLAAWTRHWTDIDAGVPGLRFKPAVDLKTSRHLPNAIARLANIRNPDIFFAVEGGGHLLGGVEVTTHSPDGSNIEKRYPYLWASREASLPGFVATPYQKSRPTGAVNRLPRRHAERNLRHLEQWVPEDSATAPIQLMAVKEMHGNELQYVDKSVRDLMASWDDLGAFFAARTAQVLGLYVPKANALMRQLKAQWLLFTKAAIANTTRDEATSLLVGSDRWVQIYNARPDTGHWERGEGQFDSIDGRLMFTLETIEFTLKQDRPRALQFWLPQLVSVHPWIREQRERGWGSKRLRNILELLPNHSRLVTFETRFADQLSDADWTLLQANSRLCLERLDGPPCLIDLAEVLQSVDIETVVEVGQRSQASIDLIRAGFASLSASTLSTHRAYRAGWQSELVGDVALLTPTSRVLVPRIPARLLKDLPRPEGVSIVPAEECSKPELLALRQLNRGGLLRG